MLHPRPIVATAEATTIAASAVSIGSLRGRAADDHRSRVQPIRADASLGKELTDTPLRPVVVGGRLEELVAVEMTYLTENPFDLRILRFKVTLDLQRGAKDSVGILIGRLGPDISGCT